MSASSRRLSLPQDEMQINVYKESTVRYDVGVPATSQTRRSTNVAPLDVS